MNKYIYGNDKGMILKDICKKKHCRLEPKFNTQKN